MTAAETAYFFPGLDGFKLAEIGKFLVLSPFARERLAVADEVLGYSVIRTLRDSDDYASPAARAATLVNALSLADWAKENLGEPGFCVGMSFGELIAAAYAECLPFADAVRIAAGVGECELDYFRTAHQDLVTQVVTRVAAERMDELLADLSDRGVWYDLSGHVDDGHYLITMAEKHLEEFTAGVGRAGGYSLYAMRPAAHCSAFGPLRDRIEAEVLRGTVFADPAVPVVSDVDGSVLRTGRAVRELVLSGFLRPLEWRSTAVALAGLGVRRLCVVGLDRMWFRLAVTKKNFIVEQVNQATVLRHRRG
ncbi:ACP S-malonyltransferase [Amycolatopsis orientalis]|uniref:ACP S-malonyltransferase n=1 Tax=Amycolatopsis orientalis TaxID=31958 RepID=UPI00040AA80D|nr:ACP S-malonyltransferase [Amycolatopsis orientalis]